MKDVSKATLSPDIKPSINKLESTCKLEHIATITRQYNKQPHICIVLQNQTVITQCVVTIRHHKQAWISNVADEMVSVRQTAAAVVRRDISHLRPRTGSLCAWYILTLFMLLCQYLTKPLWSAVNIQRSLWLQIIVRTAVS